MKKTYLIKIFTKELQTKFNIESDKDIDTVEEVHKPIIDFLGKNDIRWEPNPLKFSGTAAGGGFYITYEEVNDGSRQHGVVRSETEARI